jgi:hypothetical protein
MREAAKDGPSTGLLKLKESALSGDHDLSGHRPGKADGQT